MRGYGTSCPQVEQLAGWNNDQSERIRVAEWIPNMDMSHSLTLLFAALGALSAMTGCDRREAPSPSNSYALDPGQLRATTAKAEAGDVEAMNRLVDYYWIYRDDGEAAGLYWQKRAADAGDGDAWKAMRDYCSQHLAMKECANVPE